MDSRILRQIPKMDRILAWGTVQSAGEEYPRALVRDTVRLELDRLRAELLAGQPMPGNGELERRFAEAVRQAGQYHLRRLVNATGIVLHTNLGRAPLGAEVAAHVAETAAGYSNLEYDLSAGKRGSRYSLVEELLCKVTGAEAAMVVNNNAGAVFLMLNTFSKGKAVAISRGELVEIGGSFRVPEIMEASGADLLEIGTTNKTHRYDYERAVSEKGAEVLLKVHTSNFRVMGFTEEVTVEELAQLAAEQNVPLLYDLGSGFLVSPEKMGFPGSADVRRAVSSADVVCFSGDKLLGGGQAGILAGKKEFIERMRNNQLLRMLRVDKMTLAALEGILRWYLDPAQAVQHIPVLAMLAASPDELRGKAEHLAAELRGRNPSFTFSVVPCRDEPGGGSLPGEELEGWAVSVSGSLSPDRIEKALRRCETPVIGRIWQDRFLLSVRTILDEDIPAVLAAFSALEVS